MTDAQLGSASFGEALASAESAASALASCDDMDEALRLFREGEAGLRRAERRLVEVEKELEEIRPAGGAPCREHATYSECLRAADEATRALSSCRDAEEALRLLRRAEGSLAQADALLAEVEGALLRVAAAE